jgi:hypothetical protein
MFSTLRSKLTYANVMATLALFVALGGSSYAAVSLSRNSVKSKHIAKGQVKRSDIGKNAVSSPKVKRFSLLASDFRPGQLPAGPRGETGPPGSPGAPGPTASAAATRSAANEPIGTSSTTVLEEEITTTFEGRVLASASVRVEGDGGNNDVAVCRLQDGGSGAVGGPAISTIPDTSSDELTITVVGSIVKPPGTHTIRVCCNAGTGVTSFDVEAVSLIVWAAAT